MLDSKEKFKFLNIVIKQDTLNMYNKPEINKSNPDIKVYSSWKLEKLSSE